jgi:hypothetical protein
MQQTQRVSKDYIINKRGSSRISLSSNQNQSIIQSDKMGYSADNRDEKVYIGTSKGHQL